MASIQKNFRNGEVVSYRFRTCVGRDHQGKQVFKTATWKAPKGMIKNRLENAAQRAANIWEEEVRTGFQIGVVQPLCTESEKRVVGTPMSEFITKEWFPLCIENGEHKPKTVSFYRDTVKNICEYFSDAVLQEVTSSDIHAPS